jgi:Mg2+/citrate symporter
MCGVRVGVFGMIGFVKLAVYGLVGLSLLYVALSVFLRSLERERLEKEWDAGGIPGSREDHIRQGLARHRHSLRRKLLWLVYVIPIATVTALVWILNFE